MFRTESTQDAAKMICLTTLGSFWGVPFKTLAIFATYPHACLRRQADNFRFSLKTRTEWQWDISWRTELAYASSVLQDMSHCHSVLVFRLKRKLSACRLRQAWGYVAKMARVLNGTPQKEPKVVKQIILAASCVLSVLNICLFTIVWAGLHHLSSNDRRISAMFQSLFTLYMH